MAGEEALRGIAYKVLNLTNGKAYIGVTTQKRPQVRWAHHINCGRRGLGQAIRKYGVESFSFEIVAAARGLANLLALECLLIQQENSVSPAGYNLNAGGRGLAMACDETKSLIAAANKRRIWTEASRAKISASLKIAMASPCVRAKMSHSARNKPPVTGVTRQRLSDAGRGRKMPEAFGVFTSLRQMGHITGPETRAKISAALKARGAALRTVPEQGTFF
jgi:hypothetical protein